MKKTGIYIAIGSLAVLGITLLTARKVRANRKRRKEEFDKLIAHNNANNQKEIDRLQQQYDAAVKDVKEDVGNVKLGKFAYPSGSYVNIRTSPKVNNGYWNNIKYKHTGQSKKIGLVLKAVPSSEYGDKKTWYLIELDNGGQGYAREDVLTIKNV